MKKIILFFLFVISIFSFATEKSAEQIMDELREKVTKREEAKLREEQEKIKREEEARKEKELLEAKQKEESEKEAMRLIKEKRRQIKDIYKIGTKKRLYKTMSKFNNSYYDDIKNFLGFFGIIIVF